MLKSIQQLGQTLEKEVEIYEEIKTLAKEKTRLIQKEDLEGLKEATSQEQGLVVALFKLEEIREKVVDHVMRDKKIDHCEDLQELMRHLDLEEKMAIYRAKDRLQFLVKEISQENELNEQLIQQKLEIINVTMNLMTTATEDNKYTPQAGEKPVERKQIFDIKA